MLQKSLDLLEVPAENFYLLKDTGASLTIDDIQRIQDKFSYGVKERLYGKKELKVYWLRLDIENQNKENEFYLFHLHNPYIGKVDFYIEENGVFKRYSSGAELPFSDRPFDYISPVFPLKIKYKETKTIYLRFASAYGFEFSATVETTEHFFSYSFNHYYYLGIFYGFLLLALILSIVLFIYFREKIYLFYTLYIIICALASLRDHFLGYQFFWPSYPVINDILIRYDKAMILVGFLLFSTHFLPFRTYLKKLYQLIIFSGIFYVILYFTESFLTGRSPIANYLEIVIYLLVFYSSLRLWKKESSIAVFYSVALFFWISGYFIFSSVGKGWLTATPFTLFSFNIGLLLEVIIFGVGLCYRIKLLYDEKSAIQKDLIQKNEENLKIQDEVNRELEAKVAERTKDLELANQKLKEQAELITQMNLKLDTDNYLLKRKVNEISFLRLVNHPPSYEEFLMSFPNELSCYRMLENLKWESGYSCRKCRHTSYSANRNQFSRKCRKCSYEETITAYTLFHGIRFPIEKAFYIVFETISVKGQSTIEAVAGKVQLRTATVWRFRKKILEKMERKKLKPDKTANEDAFLRQLFLDQDY